MGPSVARRPRRWHSAGTAFLSDRDGAAAVEFALVAVPFLGLSAAIIQIAFLIWATQNFDRTLQNGVRGLLTGQFQLARAAQTNPPNVQTALRDQICGPSGARILTLFKCADLKIDVTTSDSFSGSSAGTPFNPQTGTWNTSFGSNYTCPKPGTIVTVTAAVEFPTFLGLLSVNFRTFGSGSHLLMSTAVFRTEPYETGGGASACGT
ncbi:TadE/TadG family type IV pilus assembly protein [Methylobacterium symbioticum]|uniref:TadE-like domain-containing protein n=1 Tax=Methylobacterium symbioticum TaxID=2584084 RepID=A0A509ECE8_9HYPH|nr:TadE/TadG family type IV pilus assembly protein [Methylobacterium symbioticum]VUD71946.1 hypothetical protein MET9862_02538 [Methylobacterium symbioticum]